MRAWGKWTGIVLASLLALAALAEISARALFRDGIKTASFTESDMYYYYDIDGTRKHIPGKTGYERIWNGSQKVSFRINSYGLRDEEFPLQKPEGEFRLVLLGDSITIGRRLEERDTFVRLLGEALRRGGSEIRTINAGVGDAGAREEIKLLRGTLLPLKPDLVVLGLYLNDSRPPLGFREEVIFRDPLVSFLYKNPLMSRSYAAFLAAQRLVPFLISRKISESGVMSRRMRWTEPYEAGKWKKAPEAFRALVEDARYDWGAAWLDGERAELEKHILKMRKLCSGAGARFAVVIFPVAAQLETPAPENFALLPQARLAAFLAAEKIPYLDPAPFLKGKSGLFYDNCHYTPAGNAVVSGLLQDFLSRAGLLPARGQLAAIAAPAGR